MKEFLTEWLIRYGVKRVVDAVDISKEESNMYHRANRQKLMCDSNYRDRVVYHIIITPEGLKLIGELDETDSGTTNK